MLFDFEESDVYIDSPVDFQNIGELVTELLPYILWVAGLGLLLYLVLGGFEILTSEGNPEKMAQGRAKITQAIAGFLIIFSAYWLTQILELVFGIQIIG